MISLFFINNIKITSPNFSIIPHTKAFPIINPLFLSGIVSVQLSGNCCNLSHSIEVNNTYFPGSTFNHICHVRPHGQTVIKKSGIIYSLPVPDKLTKYTKH